MSSLNRDTVIALILMAVTGIFFWESFNIPELGYASMGSAVWPRVIMTPLLVLCAALFIQSLRKKAVAKGKSAGFGALVSEYRNPIMCFGIFFVFLLTIDYLGMLIAGIAVTFVLLTAIGNRTPKALVLHAAISIISVGLVWSLFTFVLRVYLPQGELFSFY